MICNQSNTRLVDILHDEAVGQPVNGSGSLVRALPGPQFAKFIDDEIAKWAVRRAPPTPSWIENGIHAPAFRLASTWPARRGSNPRQPA